MSEIKRLVLRDKAGVIRRDDLFLEVLMKLECEDPSILSELPENLLKELQQWVERGLKDGVLIVRLGVFLGGSPVQRPDIRPLLLKAKAWFDSKSDDCHAE